MWFLAEKDRSRSTVVNGRIKMFKCWLQSACWEYIWPSQRDPGRFSAWQTWLMGFALWHQTSIEKNEEILGWEESCFRLCPVGRRTIKKICKSKSAFIGIELLKIGVFLCVIFVCWCNFFSPVHRKPKKNHWFSKRAQTASWEGLWHAHLYLL